MSEQEHKKTPSVPLPTLTIAAGPDMDVGDSVAFEGRVLCRQKDGHTDVAQMTLSAAGHGAVYTVRMSNRTGKLSLVPQPPVTTPVFMRGPED